MKPQLEHVRITAPVDEVYKTVLTDEAVGFLTKLSANFEERRQQCLASRVERQRQLDAG